MEKLLLINSDTETLLLYRGLYACLVKVTPGENRIIHGEGIIVENNGPSFHFKILEFYAPPPDNFRSVVTYDVLTEISKLYFEIEKPIPIIESPR